MSHLDHLKKEAELRKEQEALVEDTNQQIFIVNDLIQKFGREYLDWLIVENEGFSERKNYKTTIRPIPIEKAAQ
jgi:hypothetical protein